MASTRILALVHAKPPWSGRAKTRLATELGADGAARVAAAMLRDTWAKLRGETWLDAVLCTPDPRADHGIEAPTWDQGPGDLGERLERGFRRGLADHAAVVALGGDAPHLPVAHLRRLRDALRSHDAVLGPAEDGGFWALGLRRCPEGLLAGIPWSAPETLARTTAALAGLDPVWVDRFWDVDEPADLRRLRDEVPRTDAPELHAALEALWG